MPRIINKVDSAIMFFLVSVMILASDKPKSIQYIKVSMREKFLV